MNIIFCIRIGRIPNTMYIASSMSETYLNISCDHCRCNAIKAYAFAWNCLTNNLTCRFIYNYSTTDLGLIQVNNTTFYFIHFPPKPTTTTITSTPIATTTTTTTLACSKSGRGNIASLSSSSPFSWIQRSYNYMSTKSTATILFGFDGISEQCIYLDDVSIVDKLVLSKELLENPNFENSTTTPAGWNSWCSSTCGSGSAGSIASGSNCRSSGNCYRGQCRSDGIDFLVQTFPTTIHHNYTISFWYQQVRINSGGGSMDLYIDVL